MNEDQKIDEAFLAEMMKRGEKAWKDVPDATAWVEDLRTDMTQNKMSDTPTPRTQAARSNVDTYADQYLFSHSTDGEWVRYEVSEQLERELADMTKDRDEWKANHDNQVAINRALRDRPDLGERAKLVDALTKQRDALAEALREMLKFTPHSLVCQDFHHPTKDCHSESEDCQPTKRFRDALAKAEQALAATKGEKP